MSRRRPTGKDGRRDGIWRGLPARCSLAAIANCHATPDLPAIGGLAPGGAA